MTNQNLKKELNRLTEVLKMRNNFVNEANGIINQSLSQKECDDAGENYITGFQEGFAQGRISSIIGYDKIKDFIEKVSESRYEHAFTSVPGKFAEEAKELLKEML